MGNKLCNKNSVSPETKNIVKLSEKTKTKVIMITALCCSTVVTAPEPEAIRNISAQTKVKQIKGKKTKVQKVPNVNPNRPMNSKARVRRYGYKFAKVSPIILSVEELETEREDSSEIEDIHSHDDKEIETELSLEEYPEPANIIKSQSLENLYIPEKAIDNSVNEEERKRCRSAMLQKVKQNELKRKKSNELRLLQVKLKRDEEKQRQKHAKQ